MESPDWIIIDKTANIKLQFCIINKTLVFIPLHKKKKNECRFESIFDLTGLQLKSHNDISFRFGKGPQEWYKSKSASDIFKFIKTQCALYKPEQHKQMNNHIKVLCEALDCTTIAPKTLDYLHKYKLCNYLTLCTLCTFGDDGVSKAYHTY